MEKLNNWSKNEYSPALPFSVEYEFCKYETQIGTPNLKMCDKCNWNPKKEYAHSVSSYKERRESSQPSIKVKEKAF